MTTTPYATANHIITLLANHGYAGAFAVTMPQPYTKHAIQRTRDYLLRDVGLFKGKGTEYGRGCAKAQVNYQYVFVLIASDGTVAVVGKTSFWEDTRMDGTPDNAERANLGDVFKPYVTWATSATPRTIREHFKLAKGTDVNGKLHSVVIYPVANQAYSTTQNKTRRDTQADANTKRLETEIGRLIASKCGILNTNSHNY